MNKEYYIGQIFEDMYPSDAVDWCKANNGQIVEIDPIDKEIEETYTEMVEVEKEVILSAQYDDEGHEIVPENTEIEIVTEPQEKTRTVVVTVRRFEIQEVPAPSEEQIKQQRITELKAQLNNTDYKIIKCSECSLAGEALPYDIAELHAQRQALRDEINKLEQ